MSEIDPHDALNTGGHRAMVPGAKQRLIHLLNREIFIGMRRVFGQGGGGTGPLVQDISREAIVISGPAKSAASITATFRQILHGALPARTIVVGGEVVPFITGPEASWPPILYTDRGTGLRRLEIPRAAYLWSLAESQGWADEVPHPGIGVVWTPLPTDAPTDHPHDRYLVALNGETQQAQARLQKERPGSPLGISITDIDPYLMTVEFVPSSDFMSCWGMEPMRELARDLFSIAFVSWMRLYVRDPSACGWIGIDERFRPRKEDLGGRDKWAHLNDREQAFAKLRRECEQIGWERGTLARATPLRG